MIRNVIFSGVLLVVLCASLQAGKYRNFRVAIYARAYEVREMADPTWLEPRWNEITKQVKVDKIYLETHRDLIVVDEKTIAAARKFFESRGVETAGGITLTVNERNRFETFCYSNPDHRKKVKEVVEHTARLFDEVILDDFFFTSCKCDLCIDAKGDRSWTDFRLQLLDQAARELVLKPAKAVKPNVKVVIKYPNWYEHFQGLGFNLETEPPIFDGVYTGTETRDAVRSNQHLQQYHGYSIFRYFENLKPGGNGGGWVDTGGMTSTDRYAEQLALTMFAKAPEITLFDFRQLQRAIRDTDRAAWQGQGTSFDFDAMMKPFTAADGTVVKPTTVARAAGHTLEQLDGFLGELGKPIGVKCYRPFHSTGEDFLHSYLGMVGIPIDLVAEFPASEKTILLTETAKRDPSIVTKIENHLRQGNSVVITSGLLKALEGKGIEGIAELKVTDRKAIVKDFMQGFGGLASSDAPILIPQIAYLTNDSWEEVSGLAGPIGYPILHFAGYSKGTLYVIAIPDNFADLYRLPAPTLARIRQVLTRDLPVRLEGPAQVSLFAYDNDTFIAESFLPEATQLTAVVNPRYSAVEDLLSGERLAVEKVSPPVGFGPRQGERATVRFSLKPHSYRVFRLNKAQ